MAGRARKVSEDVMLTALACGATVAQAAEQARVSQRTVYRKLATAPFCARLAKLREEMVERTLSMLRAASLEAVKTLVGLLSTATPPSVRHSAGRSIVELSLRVREKVEFDERLKALESKMRLEAPHPGNETSHDAA
jgi:hypothetical protein